MCWRWRIRGRKGRRKVRARCNDVYLLTDIATCQVTDCSTPLFQVSSSGYEYGDIDPDGMVEFIICKDGGAGRRDISVVLECCQLEVACPRITDLGAYDCKAVGGIPALPTNQDEAQVAPYNIVFGDDPCGTILVDAYDDATPDACGGQDQTITRTVFIWDDLPGGTPVRIPS